jgi:release factor glutamine methyltransferase
MIKLRDVGVDSPRRDCMVLLEDLLCKDRSWVNTHGEHELTSEQVASLDQQIKKRLNRVPLAYIRGKAWFYKRFFEVNPYVLIPRPESENFIETLKDLNIKNSVIADIGTGSGCLGITAALEIPSATVDLYDIDPATLEVARQNAWQHEVEAHFYQSDLLENLRQAKYNILLANLPYVPDDLITSPEIKTEPNLALFSGKDGLDHYRKFWRQVCELGQKPQFILTESLESQHGELEKMARMAGYNLEKTEVLVQQFTL